MHSISVIGGGAAGFFAAIAAAEAHPDSHVQLLERSSHVLAKVRVSGGGRCNVTHACFEPAELVKYYPRGSAALRGPFSRFQPKDTVEWFTSRGVPLKTEDDNRIFPVSDSSESIIQCLESEAARTGVMVRTNALIKGISKTEEGFSIDLGTRQMLCNQLVLATGSSPLGWEWARDLGHTIVPPVPSLFTFSISDPRLEGLAGISLPSAEVSLEGHKLHLKGPILITHEGLSGPVILRLSAWCARDLHAVSYKARLHINWMGERADEQWERLKKKRKAHAQTLISAHKAQEIPRRLWSHLLKASGISEKARWTEVSNESLRVLAEQLTCGIYEITGKSTFKEEFVTAGGISLDEVDFRTMQSKKCPGLYFAGEILDIDAETGGFNFQNAWTTGWIAGHSL